MGRDSLGVVTGLAVLVTGLIAVVTLLGSADVLSVEAPPPSTTTPARPDPGAAAVVGLPGVGPAATRVLQWSGNVGLATAAELAQLPPSVASVLIEYGAPLRVPTISGQLP